LPSAFAPVIAPCRLGPGYLGQLTGEDKDQQLALDHLANASVQGLVAITKPEAIRKILGHLGIPSEAPRRTAARPRGCAAAEAELSGKSDLAKVDYADPPSPEW
jgi:hypothetical protein